MPQPTKLELASPDRLRISWDDDVIREYSIRELRDKCPCATCREERNAPPASPLQLRIARMKPVGNYAYSIEFSDGHDTGIFTLTTLRELGQRVSPS
jgi:DUF971 family protein